MYSRNRNRDYTEYAFPESLMNFETFGTFGTCGSQHFKTTELATGLRAVHQDHPGSSRIAAAVQLELPAAKRRLGGRKNGQQG